MINKDSFILENLYEYLFINEMLLSMSQHYKDVYEGLDFSYTINGRAENNILSVTIKIKDINTSLNHQGTLLIDTRVQQHKWQDSNLTPEETTKIENWLSNRYKTCPLVMGDQCPLYSKK